MQTRVTLTDSWVVSTRRNALWLNRPVSSFHIAKVTCMYSRTVITTAKVPGIKTYEPHVPCP